MSKSFKIIFIAFIVVAIICGIIYFSPSSNQKNDSKSETTEKIKSQIPLGISIADEKIEFEDDILNLTFTVVNKGKKTISIESINIVITDSKNNIISNFIINVNQELNTKEKIQLFASDEINLKEKNPKIKYIFQTNEKR